MNTQVTNSDRAAWAYGAIGSYTRARGSEDPETDATDLVTDIFHYLRLRCGMMADEARARIEAAIRMAELEMDEHQDEREENRNGNIYRLPAAIR